MGMVEVTGNTVHAIPSLFYNDLEINVKIVNILCSVILAVSIIAFAGFKIYQKSTSDSEGPVIKMDKEEIQISTEDDEAAILKGVTATDSGDGDVTDSLVIESISGFDENKKRTASLVAFDQDNHVTRAKRIISYSDYTPIRFAITKPLKFAYLAGDINIMSGIYAKDCIDGNISRKIRFSEDSLVKTDVVGDYDIKVVVTNSVGDTAELPLTVSIYDNSKDQYCPSIKLSEYLIYIKQGEKINPLDYVEGITYRGEDYKLTDGEGTFAFDTSGMDPAQREALSQQEATVSQNRFKITDSVDYNKVGTYKIEYEIEDNEGFHDSVFLNVVVEGA